MTKLHSLIDRVSHADMELWRDWHQSVQDLPGNPYGVTILNFRDALGVLVQSMPLPYYNRVILGAGRKCSIDETVDFYHQRFMPFRIDVNPYYADDRLLEELTRAGFQPIGLQTNLFARPIPLPSKSPKGMRVEEISAREASGFAAAYDRAYYGEKQPPSRLKAFRRAATVARCGRTGWRFFGAYVGSELAGGAGLFIHNGIATFAGAATLAKFRGRGVQACLLGHRLGIAADAGCDLLVARCNVGSTSQRNLERAGLATAYTKIVFEHTWPRAARSERSDAVEITVDDRIPVGSAT